MTEFNYETAFSRNIGWITQDEQQILRKKRVAIAGMGGVGGRHLLTHTRLGIGRFNIADFDTFDIANFNRQIGADMNSVGRKKLDVMAEMALAVNPELDIRRFPEGVKEDNIDAFLEDVDLYVDGLDFFVLRVRQRLMAECARRGIPAVTAAPLGMGTAYLAFMPGQMTFEEYFALGDHDDTEQGLRFFVGLTPAMLQMSYLVDPNSIDLENKKGPSTPMACDLCAGVTGVMSLKILLERGDIIAAPHGLHFDAFRNRFAKTWRPGGAKNWLTQFTLNMARKRMAGK